MILQVTTMFHCESVIISRIDEIATVGFQRINVTKPSQNNKEIDSHQATFEVGCIVEVVDVNDPDEYIEIAGMRRTWFAFLS